MVKEEADENGDRRESRVKNQRRHRPGATRTATGSRNYLIKSTKEFRKRDPVTCARHAQACPKALRQACARRWRRFTHFWVASSIRTEVVPGSCPALPCCFCFPPASVSVFSGLPIPIRFRFCCRCADLRHLLYLLTQINKRTANVQRNLLSRLNIQDLRTDKTQDSRF